MEQNGTGPDDDDYCCSVQSRTPSSSSCSQHHTEPFTSPPLTPAPAFAPFVCLLLHSLLRGFRQFLHLLRKATAQSPAISLLVLQRSRTAGPDAAAPVSCLA
ncbi:hypothetical protein A1F94_010472 [Pyrenophora tritici-repentis]|nr:hypothetical protein A1F94_010472 [Pyrenophora tritici-repentis]